MSRIFTKISSEDIKKLVSDQLVKLLHRLLSCEAHLMKIENLGILVPNDTNVPDGGCDGEWKIKDNLTTFSPNEFIPRKWTVYQCKAEHITKAKCKAEVATKDKNGKFIVKNRVREVLEDGGCYAFFSSHHEVKPSKDEDVKIIVLAQLKEAGFEPPAESTIEFYGCNRIADWVNKFPAVVRYVRDEIQGFTSSNYETFDRWSMHSNVSGRFFSNKIIDLKIKTIRDSLSANRNCIIRVTGLAGLGKSRLVYESIRPREECNYIYDSFHSTCLYVSYAEIGNDVYQLLSNLLDGACYAIVVIDDCPNEIHDNIANKYNRSNISIITIFHEPQQSRQDTLSIVIDPDDTNDVVQKILRDNGDLLSRGDEAINAVAYLSQGFPRIAKLILEFRRTPTLDELRDRSKLFQKLLSSGSDPDLNTVIMAQALSLFHSIGGSATKLEEDLLTIKELFCPKISEYEFRKFINDQKKRKIVQQIADTLFLTPRPLGIALAVDFIALYPKTKWVELVNILESKGLINQFAQRIEELEYSEDAVKIGELLLERGFPFDDAKYLLTGVTASQIFRSLTVLSPSVAMKVAKSSLNHLPLDLLREFKDSRRNIVRALEVLVWEPCTFQDAAELLMRLAAAENEAWSNNATESFKKLFMVKLSGTKVPAIERLKVIEIGLNSNEHDIKILAINTLGSALSFRFFTRFSDMTLVGKRNPNLDWAPSSERESLDYWCRCFRMLHAIISKGDEYQDAAKFILGKNIEVIFQTSLLFELENELVQLFKEFGNLWPEVKSVIKNILLRNKKLNIEYKMILLKLKNHLTPSLSNIKYRIRDIVSKPGWHDRKEEDGSYTDLSKKEAKELAVVLSTENTDIIPLLPELLLGEQQQAFCFGAVIGEMHFDVKNIVREILNIWPSLDVNKRNNVFFVGVMSGIGTDNSLRSTVLDTIASDAALIDLLVPGTTSINSISDEDIIRIRNAVVQSRLDPSSLRNLIQGLPLINKSSDFLMGECNLILNNKPEAAPVMFEVIFLHFFEDSDRFTQFESLFRCLLLNEHMNLTNHNLLWKWKDVALKLISLNYNPDWFKSVALYICRAIMGSRTWLIMEELSIVTAKLFEKAPIDTLSVILKTLETCDTYDKYILTEFLGNSGNRTTDTFSPLWSLDEDDFRFVFSNNVTLIPIILRKMVLYTVETVGDMEVYRFHPLAYVLIDEGEDVKSMEEVITSNLLEFGSIGSRVPSLEKRLNMMEKLCHSGSLKIQRISRHVCNCINDEITSTKRYELNQQARSI